MPCDWEIPGAGSASKWLLCLLPPWSLARSLARRAWLAYPSGLGTRAGMCWCEDGVLRFPAATRHLSSKIKMSPFILTSLNHRAYSSCCNCLLEKQAIIKCWHGHSILALGIQKGAVPFLFREGKTLLLVRKEEEERHMVKVITRDYFWLLIAAPGT